MLDECTFEKGIRCGVPSMLCANCEAAHSGIRISQDEVYKIRSERRGNTGGGERTMTQTRLEGSCISTAKEKEPDPWAADNVEMFQKLFQNKYGRPVTKEDIDDYINWGGRS